MKVKNADDTLIFGFPDFEKTAGKTWEKNIFRKFVKKC